MNDERSPAFDDLGFARVDIDRERRQGFPEVILGVGKTPAQIAAIAERLVAVPDAAFHETARAITLKLGDIPPGKGTVLIACAGTSDLPVAEEAAVTAELMGNTIDRLYDVGVAGLHRLLHEQKRLENARVVIVVAGMEGALPSVIAGLVRVPVIAVPTSIGYGASFGGIAALLGMLNSCASRVAVVNIDNGFGAACVASSINHL
jgi:NCAIR mutase (PurE)-related protein